MGKAILKKRSVRRMKNHDSIIGVFTTVIFFLALLPQAGAAQPAQAKKSSIAGRGYFILGGRGLGLSGLNGSLKKYGGYPGFSNPALSYGGGGHVLINRLLIGGEGHALVERSANGPDHQAKLGGGCGLFNIGYVVFSKSGLNIYPFIGLGGGGIGIELSGKQSAAFEDILMDPGRISKLTTYGFIVSLNLGADALIGKGGKKGSGGGFIVGARAGFAWSPARAEWEMPGLTISGGPDIGYTGFYLSLIFGGGGGR